MDKGCEMNQPSVCAVMLADGRPDMVRRAIRSFQAQTYQNRRLLIFDSGKNPPTLEFDPLVNWVDASCFRGDPIGTLRNRANALVTADIICHWDSDDWSHPERISELVPWLISGTGIVKCSGYRDMLFWRHDQGNLAGGEAWLYTNESIHYCLGTSMCYLRSAWENRKFNPIMVEEDLQWLSGVRSFGASSVDRKEDTDDPQAMMIATIHGGNTTAHIDPQASEWTRVPSWDQYCREALLK
jgi:glycosyltransferase involved in cell wall biosynthesis